MTKPVTGSGTDVNALLDEIERLKSLAAERNIRIALIAEDRDRAQALATQFQRDNAALISRLAKYESEPNGEGEFKALWQSLADDLNAKPCEYPDLRDSIADWLRDKGKESALKPGSKAMTAEQEARDMLERMGIDKAQEFSSGELVEIANAIRHAQLWRELNSACDAIPCKYPCLRDDLGDWLSDRRAERTGGEHE